MAYRAETTNSLKPTKLAPSTSLRLAKITTFGRIERLPDRCSLRQRPLAWPWPPLPTEAEFQADPGVNVIKKFHLRR